MAASLVALRTTSAYRVRLQSIRSDTYVRLIDTRRLPARWNPPHLWTVAVLVAFAPFLVILCGVLWGTPFPVSEAVALFEDVANRAPSRFLIPDTSYYRPIFHLTLSALWHTAGSLESTLAGIRLLHIIPVVLLVVFFIWHLRPQTALDAALAVVAVAVLVGSRGFRDNLEIPLSYTIVGMPLALLVWILLNREPRAWHGPAIVALTLLAIGFKEQGLVIVPVVLAAWWTRAPGASRTVAITVATLATVYVVFRLAGRGAGPMFEQSVGFGFTEIEPAEAVARFGAFPFWIYAYSGLSTIANVLFSEPTRGVFRIVQDTRLGHPEIWEIIHLASSGALTAVIAWWGVCALRKDGRSSPDSRVFIAMLVALLACGVLSFNYSRDRLGGMAVPFYALAAFLALRAAIARARQTPRPLLLAVSLALIVLGVAWQTRAAATIEIARIFALRNQMEWLVILPARRAEFAERPTYLRIMESMIDQGTVPGAPRPTRHPRWVTRTLGLPHAEPEAAFAYSLADAIEHDDVQRAYDFIREGQDPNDPITVRHPVLTAGRTVTTSPLTWAAATNSRQTALMLLGHGARMDRPAYGRAACLADALGNIEMAELLRRYSTGPSPAPCPTTNDTPLLSFVAAS